MLFWLLWNTDTWLMVVLKMGAVRLAWNTTPSPFMDSWPICRLAFRTPGCEAGGSGGQEDQRADWMTQQQLEKQ